MFMRDLLRPTNSMPIADFIDMITHIMHVKLKLISTIYTIFQQLIEHNNYNSNNRHCRTVTSYYAHKSYCIVYILIYGCYIMHSTMIVMAETTISQNRLNNGKTEAKIAHEMNQSTNTVTEDTNIDDEFFDNDQDDDEIEHLKDSKYGLSQALFKNCMHNILITILVQN